MNVVSFDIGTRNLAYAIITSDNKLFFKLIDLDSHITRNEKKPLGRCRVLREILTEVISSIGPKSSLRIVIENQVQSNVVAMSLMYALVSISLSFTDEVIIFDPKQKFILLATEYSTVGKAHKALAIKLCRDILSERFPENLADFNKLSKKDDIADSILMSYLSKN
jgi:hypothetical protein